MFGVIIIIILIIIIIIIILIIIIIIIIINFVLPVCLVEDNARPLCSQERNSTYVELSTYGKLSCQAYARSSGLAVMQQQGCSLPAWEAPNHASAARTDK